MFEKDILKEIHVNDNVIALYKDILLDLQHKKRGNKRNNESLIQKKIEETIQALETVEDKLINDDIGIDTFNKISGRYNQKLRDLKAELLITKEAQGVSNKIIDKVCKTIQNLPKLFKNSDFEQKTNLLSLVFPDKLIISKNECLTQKYNVIIELLTRVNKASQKLDTKKAIISDGLSNKAPSLGLEPRTL